MTSTFPISFKIILAVLCLSFLSNTYGQNQTSNTQTIFGKTVKNANPTDGKIRCATTEYEQFLQEKNPSRMTNTQFENWLAPLVSKYKSTSSNSKKAATIITIPVVVHIIHNGEPIGVAPNISDAQAESQITVLTQDFRKMLNTPGYNTNPVGADVEIEFVLAKQDPNGNPTNGIEHINMCQPEWLDTDIENTLKPSTIWDPTQYLNMWSLKFGDNKLLGYAQFPDGSGLNGINAYGGQSNTDGVVSSYDVFGSKAFDTNNTFLLDATYNHGRTMTHEVGHWLGLLHIWGDSTCGNDYCADTPKHHDANYGCPTVINCDNNGNEMVENYMDYTNDACMNIFTQNQKDRITTIMNNAARRNSLKTSNKSVAIPLFAKDAEVKIETDYCLTNVFDCASLPTPTNKKVDITNRGTSALTSVTLNYSINGGANQVHTWTGSLAQNQTAIVTLANTNFNGVLNVTVATVNGGTDERVSNNTDTKNFAPVSYSTTNYIFTLQQDFWGDEITWDLKNGSGAVIYSGGPYAGKHSEILPLPALITQNWTLNNNECYTFTINDSQGDGICCYGGEGYYNIKTSDGLSTLISGASYGDNDRLFFKINTLNTNTFESSIDFYLYPNPTKGTLNIHFPENVGLPQKFTISNSLGQIVSKKEVTKETDLIVNTSTLSNGVYFITISKDDQTKTLQFIKE